MYTTSSAAGISIPGVGPAALPSPKPAAAPSSSAIVPHLSSLTEVVGYVETKAGVAGRHGPSGWLAVAGRSSGQPQAWLGAESQLAVAVTLLPTYSR